MLKVIQNATQSTGTITAPANGPSISMARVKTLSAQCNVTVNTPSAKVFASTAVNTGTSAVTLAAHGLTTGLVGQMTTSGGLPSGLSTSTNYFIIVVDVNTFKFATSLANALAGTAITLSTQGSGNDTFTPTALASGTVQLQKSNDGTNFSNDGSAVSVTATGSFWLEKIDPTSIYMRVQYSLVSGSLLSSTVVVTQGEIP